MLRKTSAAAFVAGAVMTLVVSTAPDALASNYASKGCVGLFVKYESGANGARFVDYAEARNVCGPFTGRFLVEDVYSPTSFGPAPHRVQIGRSVPIGEPVCAAVLDEGTVRGAVCTEVV